jgi:hypothetical protein
VNKQHKKYREEERAKLKVEGELKAANDQLAKLQQAQNVEPLVPDLPDTYDENFESKIATRDEAIRKRATWEQEQQSALAVQQQAQQAQAHQQQEQLNERVGKYKQNATDAGISSEDLQAAGQLVGNVINDDLTHHILDDKDGALITTYLASNPTALDDVSSMSIGSAAVYIENVVKPNLSAMKPKPSNAPEPVPALRGGGIPPKEYGAPGATYE